jgi:REP element-mobilizing transposase RayT
MTSPSPLLYDTCYHIYNRGVNRENIFVEERNYALFLDLFEKHVFPVVDLFAYCMMKNHFHMAVRVKSKAEILEMKKTLRVSSLNIHYPGRESFPQEQVDQLQKPLESVLKVVE